MDGYWFTSDLFAIEPGEDEETNPGRYGRQLAEWLKGELEKRGYEVEPVIAEAWGRCVMVSRDPFSLWIGCGNVDQMPGTKTKEAPIVWHCFLAAEVPLLKRLFTRPDTSKPLAALKADLAAVLEAEPRITLVDEP